MDPPVPRRLIVESQAPLSLSPACTATTKNMSGTGLVGEFRKIRAGPQTSLRLHRLPVQPQMWPGLANTRPVADPSAKDTGTTVLAGLSGPAVHVLDRAANSHREASSPWPTTYETHTVTSQKQWEGTGISGKIIPIPKSLHPHLKRWQFYLKGVAWADSELYHLGPVVAAQQIDQ